MLAICGCWDDIVFHVMMMQSVVLFQGLVSVAMLVTADLFLLINCVAFVEAFSFLVCTIILLLYKWRGRHDPPPSKDQEQTIKVGIGVTIIHLPPQSKVSYLTTVNITICCLIHNKRIKT